MSHTEQAQPLTAKQLSELDTNYKTYGLSSWYFILRRWPVIRAALSAQSKRVRSLEEEVGGLRWTLEKVSQKLSAPGKKTHAGCSNEYLRGREDALRSVGHALQGDPIPPDAFYEGVRGPSYQLRLEAENAQLRNALAATKARENPFNEATREILGDD